MVNAFLASLSLLADGTALLQFIIQCRGGLFGPSSKNDVERLLKDLEDQKTSAVETERALRMALEQRLHQNGGDAMLLGGRLGIVADGTVVQGGHSEHGSGGNAVVDGQQGGVCIVGGMIRGGDAR
jgi:hypothetical protein